MQFAQVWLGNIVTRKYMKISYSRNKRLLNWTQKLEHAVSERHIWSAIKPGLDPFHHCTVYLATYCRFTYKRIMAAIFSCENISWQLLPISYMTQRTFLWNLVMLLVSSLKRIITLHTVIWFIFVLIIISVFNFGGDLISFLWSDEIYLTLKFLITWKLWLNEILKNCSGSEGYASNSGLSEEAALYPGLTCLQPLLDTVMAKSWVELPERQQTHLTGWQWQICCGSGEVWSHLPFLGFRWLLRDMASCIDTWRSPALDWIVDLAARSSAITSAITIFHCSNYPLLKKIHVI